MASTVIDFNHPELVARHGSWVRVQVAFYDFLFETGTKLSAVDCREDMIRDFQDGKDPYEKPVRAVEHYWRSADQAAR